MRKIVFENCLGTREGIVTNGPGLAAVTAFRDYKDIERRATNQIPAFNSVRAPNNPRSEIWDVPMSLKAGMAARTR